MSIRVSITKQCIKTGKRNSISKCPIAKAIATAIGYPVSVGAFHWWTSDGTVKMPLPCDVCKLREIYDDGYIIEPYSFFIPTIRFHYAPPSGWEIHNFGD